MKRKILYISLIVTALFVSCNDYLDTVNYSKVDNTFVFQSDFEANKAVLGAYEYLRGSTGVHSNGLYYDWMQANSDIEIMPEKTTSNARYNASNFWPQPVNIASGTASLGVWDALYNLVNRCNIILESFDASPSYQTQKAAGVATALTTMYGEISTLRAMCYYDLTRIWGDCFYSTEPIRSQEAAFTMQMVDRNDVQAAEVAHLKEVIPLMYKLGQGGYTAQRLTQGAAYGMIARLSLLRGGYALRPADWDMSKFENPIQTDGTWGKMARRNDWKEWYKEANTALKQVRDNSGATLITGGDNPFQQVFQAMMNLTISPEMLFEVPEMPGITTCERPYAFGRPSSGADGGFPPKAYGQTRFVPSFYWGDFDAKDLRRDVSVTVSGLSGSGGELLIPWSKGNVASGGGPALNKWDYSRQKPASFAITAKSQRKAGISAPYMRLGDMILLLAETEAVLAKEGVAGYSTANAIAELRRIRSRAFTSDYQATKVDAYLNSLTTADQVVKAVQNERKYELAGEGARKYDLVRWGLLAEQTNWFQKEIIRTIEELNTKGYVQYDNGNQFPSYVYVKFFTKAEATALGLTSTLTGNMPLNVDPAKDKLTDLQAMQIPGWRGNADWSSYAGTKVVDYKCMAVQGLFRYIDPASQEAKDLVAKGYTRTAYGAVMVTNQVDWLPTTSAGVFAGYTLSDYSANKPPRYIAPYPNTTISYSGGLVQNKYGYPQE